MKKKVTRHDENLNRLARIEGQVRGLQRMIAEGEYCIDILTQIQATRSALKAVGNRILEKHIQHCLAHAVTSGTEKEVTEKIEEIMTLLRKSA
ncbi:MAG: transcriptional regulator [Spartobacteria bacterium]|nr:transcriptional regulator [Spartobacteria bacterium]